MNAELKFDADELWKDVMAKAGFMERRALAKKQELFYNLIEQHFGQVYDAVFTRKGANTE